jgi:adenosylmethionine-8-amino-7-oxononanoate aminotransferase
MEVRVSNRCARIHPSIARSTKCCAARKNTIPAFQQRRIPASSLFLSRYHGLHAVRARDTRCAHLPGTSCIAARTTHALHTMSTSSLIESDRKHLIHPVASLRAHEQRGVTILESGRGAWLRDIDGNELLDAFSGLWCVNTGYGHESIVRVATEQMSRLPYATGYFHFGCEPAIRLAEQLVELAPNSLRHVYFTLGGSDAVDAAIRYITNYYNATGRPQKKQFIALERGYHGSSSVGAGLTALSSFHQNFDVPLSNQHHIPSPYLYRSEFGASSTSCSASLIAGSQPKWK